MRNDDKIEKKALAFIHETACYISLARLVTDLVEQWLEEEEARVTGFTVVGFRPATKSILAPAKKRSLRGIDDLPDVIPGRKARIASIRGSQKKRWRFTKPPFRQSFKRLILWHNLCI